jgi:coenzyme F420 hydrogenase subunit beta
MDKQAHSFNALQTTVISRGLCALCGTCIGICPEAALSLFYEGEEPSPALTGECTACGLCLHACPGADVPLLELDRFCFGSVREAAPADFGVFTFSGKGYAADNLIHEAGTAGGLVTALLVYGLEHGLIDGALVADYDETKPWRPVAKLATSREELIAAAQSKYSSVAINERLDEVVQQGHERIAIVGCPCHIEAIRKLERRNLAPEITERIALFIGLYCGIQNHFEGTRHLLYELFDVKDLADVKRIQYRGRGRNNVSAFIVELADGTSRELPRREALNDRIQLYFRERCAMCLDWSAEFADISVGDFWGPEAPHEKGRLSSFLVRSLRGETFLKNAQEAGAVVTEASPATYLLNCRGFERKKHSAAFRIAERRRYGWPTPDFHVPLNYEPIR